MENTTDHAQYELSEAAHDFRLKPPPAQGLSLDVSNDVPVAINTDAVNGFRLGGLLAGLALCVMLVGLPCAQLITSDFDSLNDVGWYGSAFFVSLCATQPLAGKLLALWPQNIVYICYIAIFELGSLLCALAPSSAALIVGRAIAGIGASGLFAGSLVVLATTVPVEKRPIFMAVLTSAFGVASILGPVVGGALTEGITWRWCFFINLPIGGLGALLIIATLQKQKSPDITPFLSGPTRFQQLDLVGLLFFSAAAIAFLIPMQFGGAAYPWSSPKAIVPLVISPLLLFAFLIWQARRGDQALIPRTVLKNRTVLVMCLVALVGNGPFQTVVYFLPIWFQVALGVNPAKSGIYYLPTVISDVVTSLVVGGLVMKIGRTAHFLLLGLVSLSVGAGLLSTLNPATSIARWVGYQILCGMGFSLLVNMPQLMVQTVLSRDKAPIGSTTLTFVQITSCAVFLAIGQQIFQSQLVKSLQDSSLTSAEVRQVMDAGAALARKAVSPDHVHDLVHAYSSALCQTFLVPAAGSAIGAMLLITLRPKVAAEKIVSRGAADSA
ncbi:hypothetical protein G7054_g9080 [Neopestalotiopsis clavispora]|nr:hypothetical protein G7054_g9080 [Neopestalotiopsis clavispora]